MSIFQQINVATQANIGAPGPLPSFLVGLSDATLADLSARLDAATMASPHLAPLAGMGFVRVADPPPPALRWITPYQFLQRFTAAERIAIEGSTDKAVQDFLFELGKLPVDQESLNLDDPQTQQGVGYLASAGVALIGAGRPAQILA